MIRGAMLSRMLLGCGCFVAAARGFTLFPSPGGGGRGGRAWTPTVGSVDTTTPWSPSPRARTMAPAKVLLLQLQLHRPPRSTTTPPKESRLGDQKNGGDGDDDGIGNFNVRLREVENGMKQLPAVRTDVENLFKEVRRVRGGAAGTKRKLDKEIARSKVEVRSAKADLFREVGRARRDATSNKIELSARIDANENKLSARIDASEIKLAARIDASKREILKLSENHKRELKSDVEKLDAKVDKLSANIKELSDKFEAKIDKEVSANIKELSDKFDAKIDKSFEMSKKLILFTGAFLFCTFVFKSMNWEVALNALKAWLGIA